MPRVRLTIRFLLLLVVVSSVLLGRIVDRANVQRRAVAAFRAAHMKNSFALYDYECKNGYPCSHSEQRSWVPTRLRNLIGDEYFHNVVFAHHNAGVQPNWTALESLERLETLQLDGCPVTDLELQHIKGMAQLRNLSLSETGVTDACLVHLKAMKQLRRLDLRGTKVSRKGVEALQTALPSLVKVEHGE
jgi:hypothetical protein